MPRKGWWGLKKKRFLLLSLVLVLAIVVLYKPALRALGRFLAPQGTGEAQAVVVEGLQMVQDGSMDAALALVREGRAGEIIVVLHGYPEKERLFAIQEHYPDQLGQELERRGLRKGQYRIWIVPINDHPITLTEAQSVVPRLAQAGVHQAFLLCRGFHTRRSLLVYQNQGEALGVRVIPYSYFPSYDQDTWWKHAEGIKEIGSQTIKLGYYVGKGFIPISSLFKGSPGGFAVAPG
jgi:hypothetical protein